MTDYQNEEPEPTSVRFPLPEDADEDGIVAVGMDFRPGTLLSAYRQGIFPWPHQVHRRKHSSSPDKQGVPSCDHLDTVVYWFSPEWRAIFPLDREPSWSRSLKRTLRKTNYKVTRNKDFVGVISHCARTRHENTWILPEVIEAYAELHRLGFAHSMEVWSGLELVGGIYGVGIGSVFCGESMFHTRTDASKIAFVHLVSYLREQKYQLFDAQVMNPHLKRLGCVEIPRDEFIAWLKKSLSAPALFGALLE